MAGNYIATSVPDDISLPKCLLVNNLQPIETMQFSTMLFPDPTAAQNTCVAIMGGGGKTSLLHRLGTELAQHFPRVLMTALTKSAQHSEHNIHFINDVTSATLPELFAQNRPLCVMGKAVGTEKVSGLAPEQLELLCAQADCTIFECDGARNLPLKAHLSHDPEVPKFATQVIILVGADVVGTPLTDGLVHRPEIFQERWSLKPDLVLDVDFIAEVVTSPNGYLEKIPFGQPITYFVNKGDRFPESAETLARAIYRKTNEPVYWGSVRGDFWRSVSCD